MSAPAERDERETHGMILAKLDATGAALVQRLTAESEIRLSIMRGQGGGALARFDVADSIDVTAFPAILNHFCRAADIHVDMDFRATRLTSSHVVLEDTGLAMGIGLFEMLRARMAETGVNGAGSSLRTRDDFFNAGVSASISVEGRKFLKVISATGMDDFRWRHVLGHYAFGGVRSEDIDDFIDALAGGMRASIFLHERVAYDDPALFWDHAIDALGRALNEAFAENTARRGLPPGVKATLL
jgi:imidazoleglycerol phosphate dehydratase HisB